MYTSVLKQPLFLIAFALILFLLFILIAPAVAFAAGELTVKVDILNVRSGPGLEYDVVGQASKGTAYEVQEEKNNWYKISFNQKEGWVASWLVDYKQTSGTVKQVQSSVDRLNVRTGPGTSFQLLTQIRPEQSFPVVKEEGEWIQIQLNDKEKGWVAKWLVLATEQDIADATQIREKAYIQATILNVRAEPSTSATILGKLNQGQEIQILEVTQGWYKISWQNSEGWVASDYVKEKIDEKVVNQSPDEQHPTSGQSPTNGAPLDTQKQSIQVTASTLNVRSSGSLDAKVIGQLKKGAIAEKISQQGDWMEISFQGQQGWVAGWLVQDVHSVGNQPQVTILNSGTNIRQGPSTQHAVVQRANQGDQFTIITTEGKWFQIMLDNGKTAYVAGWIVSAEGVPDVHKEDLYDYLKDKKIVLDPGHGGKDNGATGSHFGTLEKVVNLQVAKLLQEKFEAAGANVAMTRTTDRFLSLQQRVDVSIKEKADVFLSIHHNTNTDASINGTITYFHKSIDRTLATILQKELVTKNGLNNLRARKGNFFVLRENSRLSVLIELGFLSNYNDELSIRQSKFQENSADGILNGVAKYFKENEE